MPSSHHFAPPGTHFPDPKSEVLPELGLNSSWGVPRMGRVAQGTDSLTKDGEPVEGYCLKDKKKVEMVDPQPITMKNGKPATVGTCPICGTKIYKIGKATM